MRGSVKVAFKMILQVQIGFWVSSHKWEDFSDVLGDGNILFFFFFNGGRFSWVSSMSECNIWFLIVLNKHWECPLFLFIRLLKWMEMAPCRSSFVEEILKNKIIWDLTMSLKECFRWFLDLWGSAWMSVDLKRTRANDTIEFPIFLQPLSKETVNLTKFTPSEAESLVLLKHDVPPEF